MNRETKTIETLSGKQIVVKTYLSGEEIDAIQDAAFGPTKVDIAGSKDDIESRAKIVTLSQAFQKSQETIKCAIVAFDGSEADAYARFRQLPGAEYQDAVARINVVLNAGFPEAK